MGAELHEVQFFGVPHDVIRRDEARHATTDVPTILQPLHLMIIAMIEERASQFSTAVSEERLTDAIRHRQEFDLLMLVIERSTIPEPDREETTRRTRAARLMVTHTQLPLGRSADHC